MKLVQEFCCCLLFLPMPRPRAGGADGRPDGAGVGKKKRKMPAKFVSAVAAHARPQLAQMVPDPHLATAGVERTSVPPAGGGGETC